MDVSGMDVIEPTKWHFIRKAKNIFSRMFYNRIKKKKKKEIGVLKSENYCKRDVIL